MTIETVSVLFIVSISDVSQPRRFISDSNERVYGMWRQIIREFKMEHLVRIIYKKHLKIKSIFGSDLLTSNSTSYFKGYQETCPDFVAILKAAASIVPPSGTINLDPDIPAVIQL